jgi:DNA polymerase-4
VTQRTIAHIDMDAFYASVEQRDRPELRGRPVIVGADPRRRGVVSAASYEARSYGVRSAMPISRAARLCPHAAFLPVDMEKYQRVSSQIMAILGRFSPLVEPVSVDEAFVDLTGTASLFGPPPSAVAAIKTAIRGETALTASAGLAANKFLAKVASDLRKPDGLVVVPSGGEADFLAPLPIDRLWGVGRVMGEALRAMGITTVGRLQAIPRDALVRRFGAYGADLYELAFGRDERPIVPSAAPKSMGAETTFGRDCRDVRRLHATLRGHAERVARELRDERLRATTVTLKLRFADFTTITRSASAEPTQEGLEIFRRARTLLDRETLHLAVRLLGVSASGLAPEDRGQLPLLDPGTVRRDRLARAVDRLTDRFGGGVVRPASLLDRDEASAQRSRPPGAE